MRRRISSSALIALCFVLCYREIQRSVVHQHQEKNPSRVEEAAAVKGNDGGEAPAQEEQEIPAAYTMAACLLMRDDNHWLIEWLSYHYHVLPLSELIIMHDPSAFTSPHYILGRWKDRINILQWNDMDVIRPFILKQYKEGSMTQARLHRHRQQFFYAKCMKYYQERDVTKNSTTWLLLTDTDEFVRPNPYYNPGSSLTRSPSNDTELDLSRQGCVRSYLNMQMRRKQQEEDNPACLHIPRIQISTRRGGVDEGANSLNSPVHSLNLSNFLTTSWLYHNGREITTGHNLDGKNMVQLGIPGVEIPAKINNVHHVLSVCPGKEQGKRDQQLLTSSKLLIYHYPGTYEQYTYRVDPRDAIPGRPVRDRNSWKKLGDKPPYRATIRDDTMQQWVRGFIDNVGVKEAERLLDGVGKLELINEINNATIMKLPV